MDAKGFVVAGNLAICLQPGQNPGIRVANRCNGYDHCNENNRSHAISPASYLHASPD